MLRCWLTLLSMTELTPANRTHSSGIAVHPKAAPLRARSAQRLSPQHSTACQLHVLVAAAPQCHTAPRRGPSVLFAVPRCIEQLM